MFIKPIHDSISQILCATSHTKCEFREEASQFPRRNNVFWQNLRLKLVESKWLFCSYLLLVICIKRLFQKPKLFFLGKVLRIHSSKEKDSLKHCVWFLL